MAKASIINVDAGDWSTFLNRSKVLYSDDGQRCFFSSYSLVM